MAYSFARATGVGFKGCCDLRCRRDPTLQKRSRLSGGIPAGQ
jgi:hypothetical protein